MIQNWEQIQQSILQPILDYYKKTRHELGYDIELNENYPLIDTIAELLDHWGERLMDFFKLNVVFLTQHKFAWFEPDQNAKYFGGLSQMSELQRSNRTALLVAAL